MMSLRKNGGGEKDEDGEEGVHPRWGMQLCEYTSLINLRMTGSRTAWLKLFNWGERGTGKCIPFQMFVTLYSLSHCCDLKSWLRFNSMTSFKINLH